MIVNTSGTLIGSIFDFHVVGVSELNHICNEQLII